MQLLHPVDRMPCPKCLVLGEADPALFDKEPKASPKRHLAYPGKGSNLRLRGACFKQGALKYRQHGEDENGSVRLRPQTATSYLRMPRCQGKLIACTHGMPLYSAGPSPLKSYSHLDMPQCQLHLNFFAQSIPKDNSLRRYLSRASFFRRKSCEKSLLTL